MILKFFLNVSKEEQRERFLDRLEEPAKNWKFSMGDVAERKLWDKYQAAYQDMIRHTSSLDAPWHVVPADHKWFARVVVGSAIVNALDRFDLRFPKVDKSELGEFKKVRKALQNENNSALRVKKVAVKHAARGKSEVASDRWHSRNREAGTNELSGRWRCVLLLKSLGSS